MLYSVRMRSAQGGAHEAGGRHISGAERIVSREKVAIISNQMLERALSHTRGEADFINIVVEKIAEGMVQKVPLLPVVTQVTTDVHIGRKMVEASLVEAGVTLLAAQKGMAALLTLKDSMRGAMILCASSGRRLDTRQERGVRVSKMDIADEGNFHRMLTEQGMNNSHVQEALVLASKVAGAPHMVAELCWSDDPEYTTGYVASPAVYIRIPHCKPLGSFLGGRVFFVKDQGVLDSIVNYLEKQPVLVTLPGI